MVRSFSTGQHVFGEGEIMSGDLLPVRLSLRFTVRIITLLVIFRITVTHLTVNLTDIHSISERTDKSGFARDVSPEGSSLQFFRSPEHSFPNLQITPFPNRRSCRRGDQTPQQTGPTIRQDGSQNRFPAAAIADRTRHLSSASTPISDPSQIS